MRSSTQQIELECVRVEYQQVASKLNRADLHLLTAIFSSFLVKRQHILGISALSASYRQVKPVTAIRFPSTPKNQQQLKSRCTFLKCGS
jgi:hypothetical protein